MEEEQQYEMQQSGLDINKLTRQSGVKVGASLQPPKKLQKKSVPSTSSFLKQIYDPKKNSVNRSVPTRSPLSKASPTSQHALLKTPISREPPKSHPSSRQNTPKPTATKRSE